MVLKIIQVIIEGMKELQKQIDELKLNPHNHKITNKSVKECKKN